MRFDANRKPVHYRYDEVANAEITDDVYLASGAFVPGAVSRHQGRTRENVVRVLWLAIDCDLTDYLSITKNELYEWSDGDLITGAKAMGTDLAEIMDLLGVPLHRLDYTGYGICGYIYLGDHAQDDVPTIDAIYKELVSRINAVWSGPLTESAPRKIADSSVSDAGSRFNRLVPCPNTKGGKKRYGSTLWFRPGRIELADLDATIERRARNTVGRVIPRTGSALDEATQQDIANLLRTHWREGSRHAIALYASGILAKAGISQDQATAIIAAAADGDPELNDRIRAVETSYARARTGLETRGLYGLREWLPVEAVEWIDRTLDDVRPRNAEFTITASEQGRDDQTVGEQAPKHGPVGAHLIPISPLPTSVLSGIIGNYVDLMRPTTEASDGYHYAVGMTVVGAMIGRRVSVSYGSQMFANLNSLLVGASGQARKDTAIKRGTRMLTTPTIA
ncbi:MAG TPA: hypothetical protein PK691_10660, partial [Thermomicrobiales bacterium]|nr:hypothetical protein [Thermomicrobiales bacterium]